MHTKQLLCLVLTMGVVSASAQFKGLDDFSAAGKNPLKWGPDLAEGSGLLSAYGDGVLRYSVTGVASDDFMAWPWSVGDAPFHQSWSVQMDVHVPVIQLAEGYNAVGIGVAVLNSADPEDAFSAALENLRSGAAPQAYHFLSTLDVNGSTTETYAPTPSTNAAVRIAWDASSQILTAAYDTNGAVGGYSWTSFRTSYPTTSTNWNLTGSETFQVHLVGYSEGTAVTLGHNVIADNFYFLDDSLPSLSISRTGGQVQMTWTRLSPGFELVSSATMSGWAVVTNTVSIVGEQNVVTLEPSSPKSFFRLRK